MTFTVPRCPEDLEQLWHAASPLGASELPAWLDTDDAPFYRRVAPLSGETLAVSERERLEAAGLIVDATGVYTSSLAGQPVWSIAVCEASDLAQLGVLARRAQPVLTREHVRDAIASFVADPFLVRDGATWHLFFEVYDWRANKGEIALATSSDGRRWRYEQVVLTEDFHLSYPYVFEWHGHRFLVPESHQAGEVRLYRASRFPYEWSFQATLLEGAPFVDASLFCHGGRWWLFVGSAQEPGALRLFTARAPLGVWAEHPRSPVVVGDPSRARPGGRVIVHDNGLTRLAQDCSRSYGASVRAFEIPRLTASEYVERERPDWVPLLGSGRGWTAGGIHHLDAQRLAGGGWLATFDGWYDAYAAGPGP